MKFNEHLKKSEIFNILSFVNSWDLCLESKNGVLILPSLWIRIQKAKMLLIQRIRFLSTTLSIYLEMPSPQHSPTQLPAGNSEELAQGPEQSLDHPERNCSSILNPCCKVLRRPKTIFNSSHNCHVIPFIYESKFGLTSTLKICLVAR